MNKQRASRTTTLGIERPSPEEDARITAAAKADPDAQPVADLFAKRGRPKSSKTKQPVLLRLDQDVVARFKQSGDGWQTRMNDALRKAAGLR
ncbi:MAG TPA: BrnA antitoxin family protein [Rhizobiaceae bacterium]|nr:BrnA antitoxin family protein [Rhizobiaceae bacterium]